jgi:hypothetical protein
VSSSKRPPEKPTGRSTPPSRRGPGKPPGSARLNIKPGPPGRRPSIELPPRPRPGGLRRLSEVLLEEDESITEAFEASLEGHAVLVTAVLERTCVYQDMDGDRRLASKQDVWVEADKLPIRRRTMG